MSNNLAHFSIARAPSPTLTPPSRTDGDDSGPKSSCHGFWYNSKLVIPSALFLIYMGFNAKENLQKLRNGRSFVMIAYYVLLWFSVLLNFGWCSVQFLIGLGYVMVVGLMVLAGVFNISDFIPVLDRFDLQGVVGKMKKLHTRFDSFLDSILEQHKIEGRGGDSGKHVDLLSTLISLKDDFAGDGEKLTDTEIKALLLFCKTKKRPAVNPTSAKSTTRPT